MTAPSWQADLPSKAAQSRKAIVAAVGVIVGVLAQAAQLGIDLPPQVSGWITTGVLVLTGLGIYIAPNAATDEQYAELVQQPGTDEHRGPGLTAERIGALPTWDASAPVEDTSATGSVRPGAAALITVAEGASPSAELTGQVGGPAPTLGQHARPDKA